MALIRKCIKGKKKLFSCNGTNKGLYIVIKIVTFWYINRIIILLLNSDTVVGNNSNNANATNYASKKVNRFSENRDLVKVVIYQLLTNSREEGMKEGLTQEIDALDYSCYVLLFLIVTCVSCIMNHMIQLLCEKFLEDSSISNQN